MPPKTTVIQPEDEETKEVPKQTHIPDDLQASNLPHIICVIPFALPASGKSYCYKLLQEKINKTEGCTFDIVSSDGIRG